MSTARIVKAILNNEQAVLPVSAYLTGEYDEKISLQVCHQSLTKMVFVKLLNYQSTKKKSNVQQINKCFKRSIEHCIIRNNEYELKILKLLNS